MAWDGNLSFSPAAPSELCRVLILNSAENEPIVGLFLPLSAQPHNSSPVKGPRVSAWLFASFLLTAFYIGWHLTRPPVGPSTTKVNLCVLSALSAVAIWNLIRATRRAALPPEVRKGLMLVTAGLSMTTLGSLYLFIRYFLAGLAPSILGLDDLLSIGIYPLSVAGLFFFPASDRPVAGRWRILIDGLAFVVGVGVPLWLIAVRPALASVHGAAAGQYFLWPLLAFSGIIAINCSLLTRVPVPSRRAFWTLLAALGLAWASDLFSAVDAPNKVITGGAINWVDITVSLSLCSYLLAAFWFRTDPVAPPRTLRPAAFSPMPMITIVAVALWAVKLQLTGAADGVATGAMLVSLLVLLGFLLVRETLVLYDTLRWVKAEAQRESRARFEAIVRHSSDVIMIVDAERRIQFASPAATVALGVMAEQLTGRDFLEFAHADEQKKGHEFFAGLARHADADTVRLLRWRLRNSDGTHRYFETHGSNLLAESTVSGFVLNSRDVTERVLLDERLHQAQKMEAVGRLAGGVAHDFNNLLAVVLANSELGLMGLPQTHPVRADLEEIRRTSAKGAALTGRLLAFGQRQNLRLKILSPQTLMEETLPFLRRMAGGNVTVLAHFTADSITVRTDSNDLEQALIHLVTNACDALPKAGGALTLGLRAEKLSRRLESDYLAAEPGRYAVITVTDNGAGMDEATRAKLFEPFFSTKERSRGSGLGLASVFGFVKTAGGGIRVQSAPGRGTTIELWLPEATGSVDSAPPEPVAGSTAGTTILLVEDEAGVRKGIQRILEMSGYTVLVASSAQEARALFAQPAAAAVKLLLTDVIMPGETGPVLAAHLVSQRPDLRVLFVSGYTGDELRSEEFLRTGGQLLFKPFTSDELTAKVQEVLAGPVRRKR